MSSAQWEREHISAACVAARFDGRTDADLGIDSCRDHGHSGHLHGGAHVAAVRVVRYRTDFRDDHRRYHGVFHGRVGHRAERHQARCGLLDVVAARLYDGRTRRVGLFSRHLPLDDACVFQGTAVSGGGLSDHRYASRPRHSQHGRPVEKDAGHVDHGVNRVACLDRRAIFLGLLFEGLDHHCNARCRRSGAIRRDHRVLGADPRRVHYRLLFVPDVLPGLSRQAAVAPEAPRHPWRARHADSMRSTRTGPITATVTASRTSLRTSLRSRWCC